MWGRVRPGSGVRSAALQLKRGRGFVQIGERVETNDAGYFEVPVAAHGAFRFIAYGPDGDRLGESRTARPVRSTPPAR